MSDELVRRLKHLGDWQAADRIEAQAAEITRLRAWRDTINDALTDWLNPIFDGETPKDALRRLIGYETAIERLNALDPAMSQSAAERDALQTRVVELEGALREMIYETTHLSPQEEDGSHWCKISKHTLEKARAAIREGKP